MIATTSDMPPAVSRSSGHLGFGFETTSAVPILTSLTSESSSKGMDPATISSGVTAGHDLPAGVSSGPLTTPSITLGLDLLQGLDHSDTGRTMVVLCKNGCLVSELDASSSRWVSEARTARDRHEQNLEVVRDGAECVVRTIKEIRRGEQLCVWYGEELAMEVGVPVLTPANIQGYQEYVCVSCPAVFSYPNTLKAHLMLQCHAPSARSCHPGASLVPFHFLLQTISKSTAAAAAINVIGEARQETKPAFGKSRKNPSLFSPLSSRRSASDGPEHSVHKSAFKTPVSSCKPKAVVTSDDGLMMPDSSTDQQSALNLSLSSGSPHDAPPPHSNAHHLVHHLNSLATQHNAMFAQRLHVPYEYTTPLAAYFPLQPHLHSLGLQFLQYSRAPIQHSPVPARTMFKTSHCGNDVIPHHVTKREVKARSCDFPPSKPQFPPVPSPSTQAQRPDNSCGFQLPLDKEPLDLLPQAYFANKSKRGHLCLCCGKLYSRKYGLKIHMRTHNGYKPLKCKICSRPFGDPSNLNKHVRLHAQGDTPYRCDYCGKVLVRRRDLERHIRSRHPMGSVQADDDVAAGDDDMSSNSSPVSAESPDDDLDRMMVST